ncbi:MAG: DUF4347 domain-containing protein, partial [Hydrogenovibrio sp.]|uniref:DUF4347 domain-containing protein n=1 Tax=Hydrogenovibrio sp. TaxID=2065821 RepID=UPI0028704260
MNHTNRTQNAQKAQKAQKAVFETARKPLITALEQRVMLDGAAVATATATLTDADFQQHAQQQAQSAAPQALAPTQAGDTARDSKDTARDRKEVAVVDTSVDDYQTLVDAAEDANMDVFLISGEGDGLDELANLLKDIEQVDALHILSHGSEGQVHLGDDTLNSDTLSDHTDALAVIQGSLSEEGDILLYGCNVGAGEAGVEFVEELAVASDADVAASTDITGNADNGGDWELEITTGDVETETPFSEAALADFSGVLLPSGAQTYQPEDFSGVGTYSPSYAGTSPASNAYFDITATVDGSNAQVYAYDSSSAYAYANDGLHYTDTSNHGTVGTFTIAADGTNLYSFELTGLTVGEFYAYDSTWDSMSVAGYDAGGTQVATGTISDGGSGTYHTVDLSGFSNEQLGSFKITFDAGSGYNPAAFNFFDFTVDNMTAPVTNNAPSFENSDPGGLAVDETSTDTTSVIHDVNANDGDGGATDSVTYSITSGNSSGAFAIDADDGEIRLTDPSALDYETTAAYSLEITADDGESTDNTATQTIGIAVNDIAPTITSGQSFGINESDTDGTTLGTVANTGDDDSVTFS